MKKRQRGIFISVVLNFNYAPDGKSLFRWNNVMKTFPRVYIFYAEITFRRKKIKYKNLQDFFL